MSICYLCGREKKLIKAHIIPRKLYRPIQEASSSEKHGDRVPIIYPVGTGEKSKQCQSGVHDSNILCAGCDGDVIGLWDNYGQKLLLSDPLPENYVLDKRGKPCLYKIDNFKYKELKLFFMSILWRAAITSHPFFKQVNLGSWEKKLKNMISSQNPGKENDFSVIIVKYEGDFAEIMSNTSRQREEQYGINFYLFRFPKYAVFIKVDRRNFHSGLLPYILSPNQPLLIRLQEYTQSKEYEQILEIKDRIPD